MFCQVKIYVNACVRSRILRSSVKRSYFLCRRPWRGLPAKLMGIQATRASGRAEKILEFGLHLSYFRMLGRA